MKSNRLTREEMHMTMARLVSLRSTCERKQVGAVITNHGRVISTGYVGAPSGLKHCTEVGCLLDPKDGGCKRTVHAEANAIAFAAKYGLALQDCELYTTLSPCIYCAQLIINSGISEVSFMEPYRDSRGIDLLREAGLRIFNPTYSDIFVGRITE